MSQPLPRAPERYDSREQNQTRLLLEQELIRLRALVAQLTKRLDDAAIP